MESLQEQLFPGTACGIAHGEQETKREKGIWQRRYWEHVIRDSRDLERHINYIHFNPVKHRLVPRVARRFDGGLGWRYSRHA